MSQLLEHILNGDYASANDLFEERMVELQEQKLYETKQMVAAEMNEAFGLKFTKAEIEAKRAAGYRKATDVLGDPNAKKMKPLVKLKKKKKVSEEALDEGAVRRFVSLYLRKQKGLGKGAMIAHAASPEQKAEIKKAAAERRAERQSGKSAFPQDMHDTQSSAEKERPGRLARNLNTLMGRKPGYVAPEKSDDEKGGRVGWALRKTGKAVGKTVGFAGRVAGSMLQHAEE